MVQETIQSEVGHWDKLSGWQSEKISDPFVYPIRRFLTRNLWEACHEKPQREIE